MDMRVCKSKRQIRYLILSTVVVAINVVAIIFLLQKPKHPLHSYTEIPFGLAFGDTWEEVCEKLYEVNWEAVSQISGFTGDGTMEDVIALYPASEKDAALFERIYLRFDLLKEEDLVSCFNLAAQTDLTERILYQVEIYPNASADQWGDFAEAYSEVHKQGVISDSYSKGDLWGCVYSANAVISDKASKNKQSLRDKVNDFHRMYDVERRFYAIDVMTENEELSINHEGKGIALYEYVTRRMKQGQKSEVTGNVVTFREIVPEYVEYSLPFYQAKRVNFSAMECGHRLKNDEEWKTVRKIEYSDEHKIVYYFEDGSQMVERENYFCYGKSGYNSSSDTNDLYREVRGNGYFPESAEDAFAPQDLKFMTLAEANELVRYYLEPFGVTPAGEWEIWSITKQGLDLYAEEVYQLEIQHFPNAEKPVFTEADEAYLYEISLTVDNWYPIFGNDAPYVRVTVKGAEVYELEIVNVLERTGTSEPHRILLGDCVTDWYRQKHSYWLEQWDVVEIKYQQICYVPVKNGGEDTDRCELVPAYRLSLTDADGWERERFVNAVTGEDLH